MSIQLLPQHLINMIAAGEVIDRPVSVVKELIENSLDAGATRIELTLEGSGFNRIQISDNGKGIATEDAPLVFERYATSKIFHHDDLLRLSSYGFRGEALFSIMSVADVILQTKAEGALEGTEIKTYRGNVEYIQPVGVRTGTTIFVEQLFKRYPVRRKSLNPRKELMAILQLVEAFSLAYPQIGFIITNDKKNLGALFEGETFQSRLEKIWGLSENQGFLLHHASPMVAVDGWITNPEHFTSPKKNQIIFINHRLVYDSALQKAIEKGFANFGHKGKYPQYVLHLTLPPHLVDVNIHPQKKLIRFLHQQEILQEIIEVIQRQLYKSDTAQIRYTGQQIFAPVEVKEDIPLQVQGEILQLDETYLVALTNEGMILIDQHAGDERLWYNKLLDDARLLKTIEMQVSEECKHELSDDVYQHSFDDEINARVATIACHQSIRAGQFLTQKERQELVQKLLEGGTETLTCPHGRPTYISVTQKQLGKMFRRS